MSVLDAAAHAPLTPLRFLERAAAVFPDKVGIVDGQRRIAYRYGLTETYGPYTICERQDSWAELGITLSTNLRFRNATDGVYPLAHGYQTAALCSCTALKQPANYHWPTDTPDNVDFGTLASAIRVTEGLVRRLDDRWIG